MKTNPLDGAFHNNSAEIDPDTLEILRRIPSGLTKREYFAAVALQAFVAKNLTFSSNEDTYHIRARWAVDQADALIYELNEAQNEAR